MLFLASCYSPILQTAKLRPRAGGPAAGMHMLRGTELPSPGPLRAGPGLALAVAGTSLLAEIQSLGICFPQPEAATCILPAPCVGTPTSGTCQRKDGEQRPSVPFLSRVWLNSTKSRQAWHIHSCFSKREIVGMGAWRSVLRGPEQEAIPLFQ